MVTVTSLPVREYLGLIPGPINAEKIARVPGTRWVISSGMQSPSVPNGRLYAINIDDAQAQELYPYRVSIDHDTATYAADVEALDPLEFEPHGLDVLARADGGFSLYVVNHGGRESVEIFDLDVSGPRPSIVWRGGVVLPPGNWPNDVAPLADGGFIVSSTADPDTAGLAEGMAQMFAGVETVGATEWHPGGDCVAVEGSNMAGANGIVATPDGSTIFIAGWRNKNVVRLRRSGGATTVDTVDLGILVDNLTWGADGSVLGSGAFDTTPAQIFGCFSTTDLCFFPSKVIRIDADTLELSLAVEYGDETYGLGTTGLDVGDEIWVSSARASGIARFSRRES